MALEVGEAVVKLKFDGNEMKSGIAEVEKEAEKGGSRIADNFKGVASKIVDAFKWGMTASVSAIGVLTKNVVQSYGDFEQLYGGVETLFKDSAVELKNYADVAFQTAGLSANEYMETVTSFSASLLQGLGGDTSKAAKIANKAIIDMSDNANKMGTSMEAIQNAYQGFAKQNYTMLDNLKLGYGGTASEMARLINDSGVLGETVKITAQDVNSVSFDQIIEAIHITQDRIGITGTTAKEAASTIQGSVKQMTSAWKNLVTVMGDTEADPTAYIEDLVKSVGSVATNLIPVIKIAVSNIAAMIAELAPTLLEGFTEMFASVAPDLLTAGGELLNSLVQFVFEVLPQQLISMIPSLMEAFVVFFQTLMAYLPSLVQNVIDLILAVAEAIVPQLPTLLKSIVEGIIGAIQNLTSPENLKRVLNIALDLLMVLVDAIPDVIVALVDALPSIIDNIIQFLTDPENIMKIIEAAVKLFFGLVEAVPKILGALIGAFGQLVGNLWNGIKNLFGEFAGQFGSFIGNIFKGAINGVIGFIEHFVNFPINILNGFIDTINWAFGWIGVNMQKVRTVSLPRLAQGGAANSATAAIFGEAGTEVVLPLEQNQDNWAGLLASTLAEEMREQGETGGSPITIYMTNEINSNLDIQEVSEGLMQEIRRAA